MVSEVQLGEVAEIIMGQSPPGETYNEDGDGLPFFQGVADFNYRHPTPRVFCTAPSRIALPGDILLSVRAPIGRVNVADRTCAIGRGLSIIRPRVPEDGRYLEFALRMLVDAWRAIEGSGSVFGNATRRDLEALRVPWLEPPCNRHAIAHILGTLDDKIELNRRMSETLEQMARAIFKSWFVDFDPVRAKASGQHPPGLKPEITALFPNAFEDSELGEIPKGWKVQPFSETVEVIGGGTPKTSVPEYWGGDIPWFSVVDAPTLGEIWVVDTEKKVTQKGVEASSTKVLPVGTTIISARGTVGRLALVGVPMAMNQSCYGLRGKQGANGYFNYFLTRTLVSVLQTRAHGSVFDTITRDTLAGVAVIVPPDRVVDEFERLADPLLRRIHKSLLQSRTLAALRDALLPKLISGELRLPAALRECAAQAGVKDAERIAGRCA